jgi:hypothetical protein
MKFNYNDVDLLNAIIIKICKEKEYDSYFKPHIVYNIRDEYYIKNAVKKKEDSLYVALFSDSMRIKDRLQIHKYKTNLKDKIIQIIKHQIEYVKLKEAERKRQEELAEAKKKEWQDNLDKLMPGLRAFVYVFSTLLATYMLSCNNQNAYNNSLLSYQNQNIFTNNNFL